MSVDGVMFPMLKCSSLLSDCVLGSQTNLDGIRNLEKLSMFFFYFLCLFFATLIAFYGKFTLNSFIITLFKDWKVGKVVKSSKKGQKLYIFFEVSFSGSLIQTPSGNSLEHMILVIFCVYCI